MLGTLGLTGDGASCLLPNLVAKSRCRIASRGRWRPISRAVTGASSRSAGDRRPVPESRARCANSRLGWLLRENTRAHFRGHPTFAGRRRVAARRCTSSEERPPTAETPCNGWESSPAFGVRKGGKASVPLPKNNRNRSSGIRFLGNPATSLVYCEPTPLAGVHAPLLPTRESRIHFQRQERQIPLGRSRLFEWTCRTTSRHHEDSYLCCG